jgi:hypothetical protein
MTPAATLSDFPDNLSPMVVKELRQGMRTRLFAGVLLVLHSLMLLITLIAGTAENPGDLDGLRLGLIGLILCFVLPLRGFSALAGEIQRNTMDMLVLTRLSAARIVLGKWASLTAQSLLIAVSLLPYVVARYLYGGQDLFSEAQLLGLLWLIGAVCTAAVVCLSTQPVFWLRTTVVVIFGVVLLWVGFMFLVASAFGGGALSSSYPVMFPLGSVVDDGGWWAVLLVIALATWAVFFFLSLAATRVAPPAENSATLRRSVHGGLVLLLLAASFIFPGTDDVLGIAFFILSMATLDALTERNPGMTSVYVPFFRCGLLGRLGLWVLSPGWMSGFVFSLVLTALLASRQLVASGSTEALIGAFQVVDIWMVSALVLISSGRKSRDLLGPWIVVYLLRMVASYFLSMVAMIPAAVGSETPWALCLLPNEAATAFPLVQPEDEMLFLIISGGLAGIWLLILLVAAIRAALRDRPLRRDARRVGEGVTGSN